MQDLKITLVQSKLVWEDKEANLKRFGEKLASIKTHTDIIVLPEMFNTGFSMKPEIFSEPEDGPTLLWMQQQASKTNAAVTGSFMVEKADNFYNTLFFVKPDGDYYTYDKRHLFRMGGEDNHFTPGSDDLIINYLGWKIKFLICYDLRFPVWSMNNYSKGNYDYDLLLVVANWPAVRSRIWTTLLTVRAIENQAFVVGVNRVGKDGNGLSHSGNSNVFDPKGIAMSEDIANDEYVKDFTLKFTEVEDFREKFTVGLDWDHFQINKEIKAKKSGTKFSDKNSQSQYDG